MKKIAIIILSFFQVGLLSAQWPIQSILAHRLVGKVKLYTVKQYKINKTDSITIQPQYCYQNEVFKFTKRGHLTDYTLWSVHNLPINKIKFFYKDSLLAKSISIYIEEKTKKTTKYIPNDAEIDFLIATN